MGEMHSSDFSIHHDTNYYQHNTEHIMFLISTRIVLNFAGNYIYS
jgi:hypothetical protein